MASLVNYYKCINQAENEIRNFNSVATQFKAKNKNETLTITISKSGNIKSIIQSILDKLPTKKSNSLIVKNFQEAKKIIDKNDHKEIKAIVIEYNPSLRAKKLKEFSEKFLDIKTVMVYRSGDKPKFFNIEHLNWCSEDQLEYILLAC